MNDPNWIMHLISRYLDSAHILSRQLSEVFSQKDLISGRRSEAIPRTGVAANGMEFSFHGAGCWISNGEIVVDFDFMPDGQVNGFDAWRLHVFSEENASIVGTRTRQEVQAALEHLRDRGLIRRIDESPFYRLCALPTER